MPGLPNDPIPTDGTYDEAVVISAPGLDSNGDLPAPQWPALTRIIVTDLVGPSAANRQHKVLQKRSLSLAQTLNLLARQNNSIDNNYLRRDGTSQKSGGAGLLGDLAFNGHKATGMAAGTSPGDGVIRSQLDAEASARASDNAAQDITIATKAPLISPALSGTPTATTPSFGDNTTRIATTAFVQAALAAAVTPQGEQLYLSGSGNFATPAGVYVLHCLWVGGGGGGGGNGDGSAGNGNSQPGAGGGRGGVRYRRVPVIPGQLISYSIGAGGAGGTGGVTSGTRAGTGGTGGITAVLGLASFGGLGGNGGAQGDGSSQPPGANGADDPTAALGTTLVDGLPTDPGWAGPGGTGSGSFTRHLANAAGQFVSIGVGGAGSAPVYPNNGSSAPATVGGPGCGGGGRGPADYSQPGAAGGAGFAYFWWGF